MSYFFISYSRKQLYFAEYLVARLQRSNILTWFDVQDLDPGSDWQEKIKLALERCVGLILVASSASLRSPYVLQECQAATELGKPIHLVWYEFGVLPQSIQPTNSIDFSGDFDPAFGNLLNCLDGSQILKEKAYYHHSTLPEATAVAKLLSKQANGLIWYGGVMPIALSLILPPLTLIGLPIGLAAIWTGMRFNRLRQQLVDRKISYEELRLILLLRPAFWLILITALMGFVGLSLPAYGFISGLENLSLIIPLFPMFLILWYVQRSSSKGHRLSDYLNSHALFLWLPHGEASIDQREMAFSGIRAQAYSKRLFARMDPSGEWGEYHFANPINYQLFYHSEDEPIANQVNYSLQKVGHVRREKGQQSVDYNLLILTNQTPQQMISRLLDDTSARRIVIIASNLAWSKIASLSRFQLVDYRGRRLGQLQALALYMGNPSQYKSRLGASTTPRRFDELVHPSLSTKLASHGIT